MKEKLKIVLLAVLCWLSGYMVHIMGEKIAHYREFQRFQSCVFQKMLEARHDQNANPMDCIDEANPKGWEKLVVL